MCKPCQSALMDVKDSYHNLASPTNVKQNLWTLKPSRKWCAVNLLLVQSEWVSASDSGFPENSGFKCDQFKSTTCCPQCAGCVGCCACCSGSSWDGGGRVARISGACSPASAKPYLS